MPRGLKIAVAFLVGLLAGEAAAIAGYVVATNYFGIFDRDGGGAMGAVFVLGPALGVVLALAAAIFAARKTSPR